MGRVQRKLSGADCCKPPFRQDYKVPQFGLCGCFEVRKTYQCLLLVVISVFGLPEATTVLFVDTQGATARTIDILFEVAMQLPELWGRHDLEGAARNNSWTVFGFLIKMVVTGIGQNGVFN